MIDHTSFTVHNYTQSLAFYDATLAILGYERLITLDLPEVQVAGYGTKARPRPSFWISSTGKLEEEIGSAKGVHMAFTAPSIEAIHQWYAKCLKMGGKDNGAPGPRSHYHPGYYGAFIIDPNGWRIEACLHGYEA